MSINPDDFSPIESPNQSKEDNSTPQWHASYAESLPVEITVGEGDRKYYVHKDQLCSKSAYFKARTSFYEIDPKENMMKVHLKSSDGHDAEAFGVIAQWFYDGPRALPVGSKREGIQDYDTNRRLQLLLTRVYIEADRLIIPQLKNDIIDVIIDPPLPTLPSLKSLKLLRDTLPLDTPLERYYVDSLVFWLCFYPNFLHFTGNGWHEEANEYLQQYGDVAYQVLKRICGDSDDNAESCGDPHIGPKCRYHEHGVDAPVENSQCIAETNGVID